MKKKSNNLAIIIIVIVLLLIITGVIVYFTVFHKRGPIRGNCSCSEENIDYYENVKSFFIPVNNKDISDLIKFHSSNKLCQVSPVQINGKTMNQLVAKTDLPSGIDVASYPVEIRLRSDVSDFTYAVSIYTPDTIKLHEIIGVPSTRSFKEGIINIPPLGMFANEPGVGQNSNAVLGFPRIDRPQKVENLVGKVVHAYVRTTRPVREGDPIMVCYGGGYNRDYNTSCYKEHR